MNLPLNRTYVATAPVRGTTLADLEAQAVNAGARLAGGTHELAAVELDDVQPEYSDMSSWRAQATLTLDPVTPPAEEPPLDAEPLDLEG